MEAYEYETMRSVEDSYWWYTGIRKRVIGKVRKAARNKGNVCVLDGGCGTGGMMDLLQTSFPKLNIVGIDNSLIALQLSKKRQIKNIKCASVNYLPFRDESFDIIISLDVLYIRGVDDKKACSEFFRVLRKGGTLIVNLPAFEFLRGQHDEAVYTAKRYTKRNLCRLLVESGFAVNWITYWNSILFPFLMFWRPVSRLFCDESQPLSDLRPLPAFANDMLTWLVVKEEKLSTYISLPFGSSVFALAEKGSTK